MNKKTKTHNEKLKNEFLTLLKSITPATLSHDRDELSEKLVEMYSDALNSSFDAQLSDVQINTSSYLDWDNETLGKITRHAMERIVRTADEMANEKKEFAVMTERAAVHLLINTARSANAGELSIEVKGMTFHNIPVGDWSVTVKETKSKKIKEEIK